ncbi:U7 snRNA-associated Sm-like protein LSm11 [Colias croceus]|uniref:U7 snRNA-associated Sm-like protein LSm11 n=1 Tax=Colias crocea TaxID=72248 RepID=UPI001E281199|nr:U7 snRNA-associated Sm-like protein LSm11 [Colias croceus]
MSKESSPESELEATCSKFDPLKVLYSSEAKIPVEDAPVYENIQQYEAAMKNPNIAPIGHGELVKQREEEKKRKKLEEQQLLEEKNKQRFAQYKDVMPVKKERRYVNVLSRLETARGPLGALKDCVDQRLRVKVVTRSANSIRGALFATLVAFDKQWNLALTDVLEVWKRKGPKKRKVPPGLGTPVAKGTAAAISPVPLVTETPLGGGVWECTRHVPQLMVRGEHVVLVNIVER